MEAPEALGTSLKTVIARMQEMKSNPTQLIEVDGETASLNKMDTALSSVGISLKDASGQFRNLDEVIFELSKIWDTLDRNTQRWIANTASGSRQQSRFISLLSDSERLQELYTAALDSEDAALVQYSKSLDSMESKLNQLSTSFQQFYMQIFNGETLKAAVEYLTQFVDKLNEVGPVGAIAIVGSLVSALGSIGMAMSTKIAAAYKVSKEFLDGRKAEIQAIGDSWWDGFVANFVPKVQTATNQAVQILQNAQVQIQGGTSTPTTTGTPHRRSGRNDGRARGNVPSVDALNDAAKGGNKYADAAKGLVSDLTKLAPAISLISTLLYSNADAADKASVTIARLGSFAKIGAGIAQVYSNQVVNGITTIVSGLAQLIGLEETAGEKLARLKKDAEKANIARAESKTNLTTLDSIYKKYIRLRNAQYESNEAYEEWINYNQQIINDYHELATTYDSQGNLIVKLAEKYDALKQSADLAYKSQKKISQDADVEVASQPLYKFTAAGVGDQSKKDVQGILNVVGKATNQEEAKNFLFQELTGMSYDEAIDEWEKEFGNQSYAEALDSSPLRIPSYLAMPKRLAELMDSDNPRQYWEDNNFESTILGGFSLDDFLNIAGHYSKILQSGSSTLYKNASTNIEETVDALGDAYSETQKQLLKDYLKNQLDTLYTAGKLTTEIFTTQYDVFAIDKTVSDAASKNGLFKYTDEALTQVQDFYTRLSTHNKQDYDNLDSTIQTALDEIYGIKPENFIDPIELYIDRITKIPEAVKLGLTNDSGEFLDNRIYQTLSNLPIALLTNYYESLSQLFKQENLKDNRNEIVNDYINLFSQLSSLGLDYSKLAPLLADADFSTRSGVLDFADALTKAGIDLSDSGINLEKTANLIPITMADAEQGLTSLQTSMASAADIIKNLQGSDSEKKLAAYNTLSTLGISTDRISALAMGEDLTGEITQEVYSKYIDQQKTNLKAIIDSLYKTDISEADKRQLDSISAMVDAFDIEVAEAAGTRATNIVSLSLSQIEDVLGGKSPTLSRNDISALTEAGATDMLQMLEQTGSDTWTLKAGVTTKQWATAVAGLAGSVTEPGYELITALINASGKEWTKAVDNADLENFIAPMLDAVSDSGDITFGEDLYKFLSEHVSQDIIDKFDSSKDGLTALTGLYDFDGTVKEWLDMVQEIIEELFPSYSKEFAKWREKNEYGLNQSREYKQVQDKMDKVHPAEESDSAMADIVLKMKNMEASTDDATEAVRRFNLEYTDLVQLANGKWGLSTAGLKKFELNAQIVSVEDYRTEIAKLKEELLSAQKSGIKGSQEEANRIKTLIALREQELKLLNEKNQLVSQNADDYNTLLDAPENYAKNILSYADELKSAAKTGYIEISTLSNVINNLGPASNTVKELSKQLNVDLLEDGTANIVALTDALYSTKKLATIDGKPMVQIGSAMANMLQGAAKLDLKDVAQQNIDMLDGMIATLESLEALGDAEIDSDLKVDMLTEATFTTTDGKSFTSFDALWKQFKETAENNPDLWIKFAANVTADIRTDEGQRQFIDLLLGDQGLQQSMGIMSRTVPIDLLTKIQTIDLEDQDSIDEAKFALERFLGIVQQDLQTTANENPTTVENTATVNTTLEDGTTTDNRGQVNDPNGQLLAEQTGSAAMTEYLAARKAAQATAAPAMVPVQLDTTLADQFMDKLQQRIEQPKVAPLTVDPTQGEKTVEQTVQFVERQRPELTIDGDGTPAVSETKSLLNYVNSQAGQIQIYGADNVTPLVDQIINNLSGRSVDIQVNIGGQSYKNNGSSKRDQDKKNKRYSALANGTDGVPNTGKALVGELGPEMVVQGNTYRVVGQYGAEFVNLRRGDVVFNASDTARLMKNKDGVRGTALVNGTGPAYGSGLEGAIKSLKEARAAWSSILNSVPDMLKKGSGGGGGGGGSDKADKEYLMQLEKWFNWLRRIEELENRITVLRAKRENLKDGKQYADSLYEENAYLKKQSDLYAGLIAEQKAYRKQLQDDYLKNYSKYFYFIGDAIQINADAILADTKNNEELGEKIQDLIDDYKDVTEQITENTSKLEENKTQMDENIRTLRDKYIEMENEVLNALKSMYQKEIDAKQKALDEMKEADDAYLDSLKKNLDKEKSLRDKSKAQQEKQTLQRKIALLSRDTSGANAKELADLRQQLRDMQEDQYFSDREDAITSVENATQAQQDALQKEIDSLNEANQIKLDNMQLYWEEVQNIINQGSENILSFLQSYSDSYAEMSKIQQEDYTNSWKQTIDAALEYAKDMQKQFDEIIAAATEALRKSDAGTTGGLNTGSGSGGSDDSDGGGSFKEANSSGNHKKKFPLSDNINAVISNIKKKLDANKTSDVDVVSRADRKAPSSFTGFSSVLKKKTSTANKKAFTKKYASGGVVDYTGLAWVDGTPSKPETFLSAADTNLLANFLKAAHSLNFGLSTSSVRGDISGAPIVNVDSVEINITQAELKDDADLSKLSQDLSQKFLMDIARQSGNISISRR